MVHVLRKEVFERLRVGLNAEYGYHHTSWLWCCLRSDCMQSLGPELSPRFDLHWAGVGAYIGCIMTTAADRVKPAICPLKVRLHQCLLDDLDNRYTQLPLAIDRVCGSCMHMRKEFNDAFLKRERLYNDESLRLDDKLNAPWECEMNTSCIASFA